MYIRSPEASSLPEDLTKISRRNLVPVCACVRVCVCVRAGACILTNPRRRFQQPAKRWSRYVADFSSANGSSDAPGHRTVCRSSASNLPPSSLKMSRSLFHPAHKRWPLKQDRGTHPTMGWGRAKPDLGDPEPHRFWPRRVGRQMQMFPTLEISPGRGIRSPLPRHFLERLLRGTRAFGTKG